MGRRTARGLGDAIRHRLCSSRLGERAPLPCCCGHGPAPGFWENPSHPAALACSREPPCIQGHACTHNNFQVFNPGDGAEGTRHSPTPSPGRRRQMAAQLRGVVLGQVMALLIACTAVCSELLVNQVWLKELDVDTGLPWDSGPPPGGRAGRGLRMLPAGTTPLLSPFPALPLSSTPEHARRGCRFPHHSPC